MKSEKRMEKTSPKQEKRRKREGSDRRGKETEKEHEWGKKEEPTTETVEKEKPSFKPSGALTKEQRMFKGVELKYMEPDDTAKPKTKWRLYPFKEKESFEPYKIY